MPPKKTIKPNTLNKLVHDLSSWFGGRGATFIERHEEEGYTKYKRPQDDSVRSARQVAEYHADTLSNSYVMHVGKDVTYLAANSQMKHIYMESNLFPKPSGFIHWETPIGSSADGGLGPEDVDDIAAANLNQFLNSPSPVVAASWRVNPDFSSVFVTFYTDPSKTQQYIQKQLTEAGGRKNATPTVRSYVKAIESAPLLIDKEVILPLWEEKEWISEAPQSYGDVVSMLGPEIPEYSETMQKRLNRLNEYVPVFNQMVKIFIATLALRKMKVTNQETVFTSDKDKRKLRNREAAEEVQNRGVTVIRIGALKRKKAESSKSSGKGSKWTVKTVVGPVERDVQYIPATGEYRKNVGEQRWIEPFVAGPPDAPWSDSAKVYLLE